MDYELGKWLERIEYKIDVLLNDDNTNEEYEEEDEEGGNTTIKRK